MYPKFGQILEDIVALQSPEGWRGAWEGVGGRWKNRGGGSPLYTGGFWAMFGGGKRGGGGWCWIMPWGLYPWLATTLKGRNKNIRIYKIPSQTSLYCIHIYIITDTRVYCYDWVVTSKIISSGSWMSHLLPSTRAILQISPTIASVLPVWFLWSNYI